MKGQRAEETTPSCSLATYSGFSGLNLAPTSSLASQLRQFQTSAVSRDIDQAAKYIGAGAATVGAAGSGNEHSSCRNAQAGSFIDSLPFAFFTFSTILKKKLLLDLFVSNVDLLELRCYIKHLDAPVSDGALMN